MLKTRFIVPCGLNWRFKLRNQASEKASSGDGSTDLRLAEPF